MLDYFSNEIQLLYLGLAIYFIFSFAFRYLQSIDNISSKIEHVIRRRVDVVIRQSVEEGKGLEEIQSEIKSEFHSELSELENTYVEDNYIDFLVELWINEAVQQILLIFDPTNVSKLIKDINSVDKIIDYCKLLDNSIYNKLVAQLTKSSIRLKHLERKIVCKFKYQCLTAISHKLEETKDELNFIKSLVKYFKSVKDVNEISNALKVDQFIESADDLSFKGLLVQLQSLNTSSKKVIKLKRAGRKIQGRNLYSYINYVKELITEYLRPTVISEEFADGRLLLIASGAHIVFSNILKQVESAPNFPRVEEVRFVNAGVIHIDSDLIGSLWHGKNLIIVGTTVIVRCDQVITLDVSGQEAKDSSGEPADIAEDGSGLTGKYGNPGESGGNVCILVDTIENGHNLKIISNGGNGSKGQDGGNGKCGKMGSFIKTKEEFLTNYPPASTIWRGDSCDNVIKALENISSRLHSVDVLWYGLQKITSLSKIEWDKTFKKMKEMDLNEFYFEGNTEEGCHIQYSFYHKWWLNSQSFFLFKGAKGELGKPGGVGGLGGKGGFAGIINIHIDNACSGITVLAANGKDGTSGRNGTPGEPGKCGADRAYMDCACTLYGWPKVFVPDKSKDVRLHVQYVEDSSGTVKCPFKESYAKIVEKDSHKQIVLNKFTFNTTQLKTKHFQKEVQVQRKKTICQSDMEHYRENTLMNIYNAQESLEVMKTELLEIIDLETTNCTTEERISRQVRYSANKYLIDKPNLIMESNLFEMQEYARDLSITDLLENVKNDPCDSRHWMNLSFVRLNYEQLQYLWNIVNSNAPLQFDNSFVNINHVIFCEKYQLAVLEYLESEILSKNGVCGTSKRKIPIRNMNLITINENDVNDSFSDIELYFCKDSTDHHTNISVICEKYLKEKKYKSVIETFLDEFGDSCEYRLIQKLSMKTKDFITKHNKTLTIKLFPLKTELQKIQNKEIYQLLIESIINKDTESKLAFDKQILLNTFLKKLYQIYLKGTKNQFDWSSMNVSVKKRMKNILTEYIYKSGLSSAFCRELLALHYDTNVLLYRIDDTNELALIGNHNPKASTSIHLLQKEGKFFKINIDDEYAKLIETHDNQNMLYTKLLLHVDSFREKRQFDGLIESLNELTSNSQSLLDHYQGVDKAISISIKVKHILCQEDNITTISEYFTEDSTMVKCRLEKLKFEYIGYHTFLHYIAYHFKTEQVQMTAEELCIILNILLKLSIKNVHTLGRASWIIAAYPQLYWLNELALLILEIYFKKTLQLEIKSRWRTYLSCQNKKDNLILILKKINNENCKVSLEYMEEILFLLANIPNVQRGLSQIELGDWKYYLKDAYWIHQLRSIANWSEEQLKALSFYFLNWENVIGIVKCQQFLGIVKHYADNLDLDTNRIIVVNTLKFLTNRDICFNDELFETFSGSPVEQWENILNDQCINNGLCSIMERDVQQLIKLIRNSGNTSTAILNHLIHIKTNVEFYNYISKQFIEGEINCDKIKKLITAVQNFDAKNNNTITEVFNKLVNSRRQKVFRNSPLSNRVRYFTCMMKSSRFRKSVQMHKFVKEIILLSCVEAAVHLKFGIKLRNTQKLAIMTFLNNPKKTLAQVSTGEGKSLIVVAVAIIKANCNEKVDVITSSKVLAQRDAQEYREVFEMCGVSVGHNCSEDIEVRKKTYSSCQVLYGDLSNFQRDFLLDRFYDKNIFGDRTFQTVVVDEVDSMLLDKGNNMLYLSHDIPGLDKLEPLFVYLWNLLNSPAKTEEFEMVFNIAAIKEHILYVLFGWIKKEHIKALNVSLNENEIMNIWRFMIKEGIISDNGKLLKQSLDECNINKMSSDSILQSHLKFLLKKVFERKKHFEIPIYLKSFVENHIEEWIKSGMNSIVMENGRDYVVDVDRSDSNSDRDPNITIIDRDTGTDLFNSQWDEGLHQFLQLKHGCKLSLISLKAVFISNVSYFNSYSTLLGLSGTLGCTQERELLNETYKVDFVTVPTAKAKSYKEEIPVVCLSTDDWLDEIWSEVNKVRSERSVLVICETVNDVFLLKKRFLPGEVHTYTRDYEELKIAKDLKPGHVIISTNLAGRGTDITLSKELVDAGGLHVCLSFLPSNRRVEEQAYGRVARNGQPGSARLIFKHTSQSNSKRFSKIVDVKKERDINELLRLADIKNYLKSQIELEENYFNRFMEMFRKVKETEHQHVKLILQQVCLDQWAFWLDKNTKLFSAVLDTKIIEDSFEEFQSACRNLSNKNFYIWSKEVKNPFHLVKLGLVYLEAKDNKNACSLFDQVINEEPFFCETAYYYRLCVKTWNEDLQNKDILSDLEIVARMLMERMLLSSLSGCIIDRLKESMSRSFVQINSFKEQQDNLVHIYTIFLNSINNILGHEVTPESFFIPTEINEQTSCWLYSLLLNQGVIRKPQIKAGITENDVQFSLQYGILPQQLKMILDNFKSSDNNDEQQVIELQLIKELKKKCVLPTRERFWKLLVEKNILKNEKRYVFVNTKRLGMFDPSLNNNLKNSQFLSRDYLVFENKNWLYELQETSQLEDKSVCKTPEVVFEKEILKEIVGDRKYKLLKRKGIFHENKQADFLQMPVKIMFDQFDSISVEDFEKLGIHTSIASKIIDELKKKNIIKENPNKSHSLLIPAEDIDNIELEVCKGYTEEVQHLLEHCFAFRVALEKSYMLSNNAEGFCFPLPVKCYDQIVSELKDRGIITKCIYDSNINLQDVLAKAYPQSISETSYHKLFNEIYSEEKSKKIVSALIKHKWLIRSNLWSRLDVYTICDLKKKPELDSSLKNEIETISLVLSNYQNLLNNLDIVKNIMDSLKAGFVEIDTPNLSVTPLFNLLKDKNIHKSAIEHFTLNGFDQIVTLHEKKWTRRMFIKTGCVMVAAVAQIAVGAVLVQPLIIAEGVGDIEFAVSCLFSGYCTWKAYSINKLISLIMSLCIFTANVFKSTFGERLAGLSFQSIKEKAPTLLTNIKNCFMSKPAEQTYKSVLKNVVIKTVQGVSVGAAYATVEHIIQPQLMKLSEAMTEDINSNIDITVEKHTVFKSVSELYCKIGEKGTERLLNKYFTDAIGKCNLSHKKDITEVAGSFRNVIDKDYYKIFHNIKQGDCNKLELFCILQNIIKLVQSCQKYYTVLTDPVSDILNEIEDHLLGKLKTLDKEECNIRIESTQLEDFNSRISKEWSSKIIFSFSNIINEQIVSPVVDFVSRKFIDQAFQNISSKCADLFEKYEDSEYNKNLKNSYLKDNLNKNSKKKTQLQSFADYEYDMILLNLLQKKRNINVFVELLKRNSAVDSNFTELCCKIIPVVLRKEGIVIPSFEIVIDRNGTFERFSTTEEASRVTVVISPEDSVVKNLENNKLLIKDLFNVIYSSLIQSNPEYNGYTAETLHGLVIYAIEHCDEIKQFINQFFNEQEKSINHVNIPVEKSTSFNNPVENPTPYQHSHCDRNWTFNSQVDIDLREEKILVSHQVDNHIINGFKAALRSINNHIHVIQKQLPICFNLELEDFVEVEYEICPQSRKHSRNAIACYPTQYVLVVPLPVETVDQRVDFKITMSLRSHIEKTQPQIPHVPHILYEIDPVNSTRYLNKGVKGHVLLSIECQNYSLKDCKVAGDLILPTSLHTGCGVLIVGDSLLEHVSPNLPKYILGLKWLVLSDLNKNIKELTKLVCSFNGLQCIVLHIGTLFIMRAESEEKLILEEIEEMIKNVLCDKKSVKIILSSLIINKSLQKRGKVINKKINRINKLLSNLAKKLNLIYLETNKCVNFKDWEGGGVLKKISYYKISNHIKNEVHNSLDHIKQKPQTSQSSSTILTRMAGFKDGVHNSLGRITHKLQTSYSSSTILTRMTGFKDDVRNSLDRITQLQINQSSSTILTRMAGFKDEGLNSLGRITQTAD